MVETKCDEGGYGPPKKKRKNEKKTWRGSSIENITLFTTILLGEKFFTNTEFNPRHSWEDSVGLGL